MEIPEEHRKKVEVIAERIECPRGYECCKAGSARRPRVREVVTDQLIECLEDSHQPCAFAVDFGSGRFCECPVLNYIATSLGIKTGSVTR